MKSLIASIVLVLGLSGCTGVISGHTYTKEDVVKAKRAYEAVKAGYEKYNVKEDAQ